MRLAALTLFKVLQVKTAQLDPVEGHPATDFATSHLRGMPFKFKVSLQLKSKATLQTSILYIYICMHIYIYMYT